MASYAGRDTVKTRKAREESMKGTNVIESEVDLSAMGPEMAEVLAAESARRLGAAGVRLQPRSTPMPADTSKVAKPAAPSPFAEFMRGFSRIFRRGRP